MKTEFISVYEKHFSAKAFTLLPALCLALSRRQAQEGIAVASAEESSGGPGLSGGLLLIWPVAIKQCAWYTAVLASLASPVQSCCPAHHSGTASPVLSCGPEPPQPSLKGSQAHPTVPRPSLPVFLSRVGPHNGRRWWDKPGL